jgi:hypothetical protein
MSDTTTNLLLPYILAAQAQKHVTHNEALRMLDGLVQLSVRDRDLTASPLNPVAGDRYIVASGATGAWSGWDGDIALYGDGLWFRLPKQIGWRAWVEDEAALVVWEGSQWDDLSGGLGSDGASAFDVWIAQGNSGTEDDFLASLIGSDGPQGPEGPAGPAGADGATGPQGPTGADGTDGADGTSVTIVGSLATTSDLPVSGATPGDGYVIAGDLHVWDGTAWNRIGPIQGPPGLAWKGAWASTTSYTITEAVAHLGASYLCITDHTADAVSEPGIGSSWASSWDVLAAKGDTGATGPVGADGADGATGPEGPQGPPGVDGTNGAPGADGLNGADGVSFVWQGAWTVGTTYALNDAAANAGASYICTSAHTADASKEPGVGASWSGSWDLMAGAGDLTAQGTLGSGPVVLARRVINTQAGSYTLAPADEGASVHMTSTSAATLTIPSEASAPFPIGTEIEVIALGAGPITMTAVAGVTLNGVMAGSADINAQWQGAVLRKYAVDTWLIIGAIGDVT